MDIDITVVDGTVVDLTTSNITVGVELVAPAINIATSSPIVNLVPEAVPTVELGMSSYAINVDWPASAINVDVIGGGGGYVEKDFQTIPVAITGAGEYSIDVGKQFFVLGYSATVAGLRIRGYVDETYMDFDSGRPLSEDPLLNGGVLFEIVTEIGDHRFSLAVPVYSQTVMPILVDGPEVTTTVNLFVY